MGLNSSQTPLLLVASWPLDPPNKEESECILPSRERFTRRGIIMQHFYIQFLISLEPPDHAAVHAPSKSWLLFWDPHEARHDPIFV